MKKLILILTVLLFTLPAYSQWVRKNSGGTVSTTGTRISLQRSTDTLSLNLTNTILSGYVPGNLIPRYTDTYSLGSSTNLWLKGWLSELEAVLFAKNTISLLGSWFYITKDAGTFAQDVESGSATIDFGQTMTPNDFVVCRNAGEVEYIQVGSLVSGTVYNVTRNLDASGANNWVAGTPFAVLGYSGDPRIEFKAGSASGDTRISLVHQGTVYNGQTERLRIGNLESVGSLPAGSYGIWSGNGIASYFYMTEDSSKIAGYYFNDTAMWSGTGTYGNSNTPFFQSSSGRFSLGDKLTWDGTTLGLTGEIVVSGTYSWDSLADKPTTLGEISPTEASKLAGIADGATVGATWGTNLNSIPSYLASTAPDNSLSITSTFMGFHATGTNWPIKIANDGGVGKFYAGNGSDKYIDWNGSTLTIQGYLQTSSSGKRILIDNSTNEMSFYEAGGERVRIGSGVIGGVGGIYITSGAIAVYNSLNGHGISSQVGSTSTNLAGNFNAVGVTTNNYAVYANAVNGTNNYSFYGAAGSMYNAGNINIASGYNYKINGVNLAASNVGAIALGGAYTDLDGYSKIGTGSTQVARGNHTHGGVYEPAFGVLSWSKGGTGNNSFTSGQIIIADNYGDGYFTSSGYYPTSFAPATQGATFGTHDYAGCWVATSYGAAPTKQLEYVAITINGVTYNFLIK